MLKFTPRLSILNSENLDRIIQTCSFLIKLQLQRDKNSRSWQFYTRKYINLSDKESQLLSESFFKFGKHQGIMNVVFSDFPHIHPSNIKVCKLPNLVIKFTKSSSVKVEPLKNGFTILKFKY